MVSSESVTICIIYYYYSLLEISQVSNIDNMSIFSFCLFSFSSPNMGVLHGESQGLQHLRVHLCPLPCFFLFVQALVHTLTQRREWTDSTRY